MVQWTLGLLVVLGAILGCAWLLRKIGQLPAAAGLGLRIIGGVSVGTRERVLVLQAGKKQLVLGVAPGLIEMLCVLEESDGLVAPQPESKSPGGFAEQLRQTLRGGSNG